MKNNNNSLTSKRSGGAGHRQDREERRLATSSFCARSISRSRPARRWRSSAPPARASPRCSRSWRAWTRRPRARAASTAPICSRSTRTSAPSCAGARVGFVFQSFQLLPALTALENVMLPLELRGRADAESAAHGDARARRASASACTTIRSSCRAASSSASRWRAPSWCGRSCCSPTSRPAASTRTGAAVIELMFELNREYGTTLVLVTHDGASRAAARAACGSRRAGSLA